MADSPNLRPRNHRNRTESVGQNLPLGEHTRASIRTRSGGSDPPRWLRSTVASESKRPPTNDSGLNRSEFGERGLVSGQIRMLQHPVAQPANEQLSFGRDRAESRAGLPHQPVAPPRSSSPEHSYHPRRGFPGLPANFRTAWNSDFC